MKQMPATKEVPLLYHLQVDNKPSGFTRFPTAIHKSFFHRNLSWQQPYLRVLLMMQDKIRIALSRPRETFLMRSTCNVIGQYLKNNREMSV